MKTLRRSLSALLVLLLLLAAVPLFLGLGLYLCWRCPDLMHRPSPYPYD